MTQSVIWPPIGGASYPIPDAGEENWPDLTDYLVALSNAQGTLSQKWGARVALTSPVTVSSASDCAIIVNRSVAGATIVNLPVGVLGLVVVVVDGKGDALTNSITVVGNGADTINGAASYVIAYDRGGVSLIFSGSGNWTVFSKIVAAGGGASARSSIDAATPGYVVINDPVTGLLSEEQRLATSRGGTGIDASAATGYLKVTAGVFSASAIAAADLPTGIDPAKLSPGTVSSTELGYLDGTTAPIQAALDGKAIGQASASDSELALFSGTGGKQLKRATGTGIAVLTSGVLATATFDNITPSQTGNSGKYLTTNGSVASWATVAAGGYTVSQVTADPAPAVDNTHYAANTTSAPFTITLPALVVGKKIKIQDALRTWGTNNLTIAPASGEKIYPLGINETLVCNLTGGWIELIGVTGGWSPNSLASTTSGGGAGLTAIATSVAVPVAIPSTMYQANTTSASFTITLPSGTSAAVIGVMDAGPKFSTNKCSVDPGGTNSIQNGVNGEIMDLDVDNSTTIFYRANGSTVWEIQTSAMTQYAPGFVPGYTGSAAIAAGNIGEQRRVTFSSVTITTTATQVATISGITTGIYLVRWYLDATVGTSTRLIGSVNTSAALDTTQQGETSWDCTSYGGATWVGQGLRYLQVTATTSYYLMGIATTASATGARGILELVRIV